MIIKNCECSSYPDKGYFFSWRDPALRGVEEDWLSARNYCRQRCMDLVSLETSDENEWVKARIVRDKVIIYGLQNKVYILVSYFNTECSAVLS